MASPYETEPRVTPLEAFSDAVRTRRHELEFLVENLEPGLKLVSSPEKVNAIIKQSSRPELILADRAEQLQIAWPYESRQIHNFIVNLQAFGPRIEEMQRVRLGGEDVPVLVSRRLPTDEELNEYFIMGARGDRTQHHDFAEAKGIASDVAGDMLMSTLVNKPAFVRMWILFPDLTEYLLAKCLDDRKGSNKDISEEIFVAYSLMSQLVDKSDRNVIKEDGSVDNKLLCR